MKLIVAIIKPFKLDDVRASLAEVGVQGLTVSEVKGFGRQRGHGDVHRGVEFAVHFLPKVKLEIAVSDDQVADAVAAIQSAAFTGQIGDGKIMVLPIEQLVRIRTGEQGGDAL